MKTNKEKIFANSVSSISLTIFNSVKAFITRIIFLRILDASYLGINSLFVNILGILSLADLGLNSAMMYSLYKPVAEENEDKIASLVCFFRKVFSYIAITVLALGLMLIPLLPYIINLEDSVEYINIYYILALLNVVMSYMFVYRTILIAVNQKQYIINRYNFVFSVISFIIQISILVTTESYLLLMCSNVVVSFLNNVILNEKTKRMYPFLKKKASELSKTEKKNIAINVKSLFIYKFCATLINNTDNIFISIYVGTITVGIYSNYTMVIVQITSIISIIFGQIKAATGNALSREKFTCKQKYKVFQRVQFVNFWIVGFSAIAFVVLLNDFVELMFGTELSISFVVVLATVLNFYSSNIRQTLWAFRETTTVFVKTKYVVLVTVIINMSLSIILGYFYGLFGILIATVISKYAYAWWKEAKILYNDEFEVSLKEYISDDLKKMSIMLFAGLITLIVANMYVFDGEFVRFIYKIFVCTTIPNIVFWVFFRKTVEYKYYKDMILKKI